ncbi:precorrin-6A reductase [Colibacter massiliensis]|uniref:precorrin-6A reductase n=1 Tax=Colibacter massiliensis TaxID=1852379 RepID=UPI002356AFB3|nr:precorrin-6A reductase [Colibacter massiliensis]
MNRRIWIAAGTTEGRRLAEELARKNWEIFVTVATEYGASLVEAGEHVTVFDKRLDEADMRRFLDDCAPDLVVDATHPYAAVVTETLRRVCAEKEVLYKRLLRPEGDEAECLRFSSPQAAADWLGRQEGKIFLTTGSKDLPVFIKLRHFKERLIVRILPVRDSLDKALNLGLSPAQLICMQGPFSVALNREMFKSAGAAFVVTKNSGAVGGFEEKLIAAREAGARLIVIERPEDTGIAYDEMVKFLETYAEK